MNGGGDISENFSTLQTASSSSEGSIVHMLLGTTWSGDDRSDVPNDDDAGHTSIVV